MKITILDKYIIKKFLGTFFYALSLIIVIVVVFDIAEKIDDFIESEATLKQIIFDYYLNFIPYFANLFSPLFIFISVVFFTSRMASNTEIVAILSSGVSFYRLLIPYFVVAFLLAIFTFYLNSFIIPPANKKRLEFENTFIRNPYYYNDRDVHMQVASGEFIYTESYNNTYNTGYKFSLERFNEGELYYKLTSKQIRWLQQDSIWMLENCIVRNINGMNESLEEHDTITVSLNLHPSDFERRMTDIASMNNEELNNFIDDEIKRGADNIEFYLVEKYKRYAFPFSTFILTLIGIALSSRKVKGGTGMHIGIGITSCFSYILFMQISTTFAINGGLSPFLSVWIPNILFTIYALYLLKLAPK